MKMDTDLRDRAVLPVLIPLAAIVVTEIVVFAMSRVLLTAGKNPAVVIALASMVGIMVVCTYVALRPRIKTNTILALSALALIATVGAGGYAMQRGSAFEGHEAPHADLPEVELSAAGLAFDTEALMLEAGGSLVAFSNDDSEPHNLAIFTDDSLATNLFRGDIIDGGAHTSYEVTGIEVGTYYFHCDVHPTMNGQATVA